MNNLNNFIVHDAKTKVQNLSSFMNSVYTIMFIGIGLTGLTAWLLSSNVAVLNFTLGSGFWLLFILQIGLVVALSAFIEKLSGGVATFLFFLYSIVTGVTFSVFFLAYTQTSIASAFFVTAGMFAALSIYGYTTKKNLSGMGNFLFMALIGLVLATLVNIFLQSESLMWITTYIGVFIFAGLTAYDTQMLKQLGDNIDAEHKNFKQLVILGALKLYLDFINLFIMILRIMGNRNY